MAVTKIGGADTGKTSPLAVKKTSFRDFSMGALGGTIVNYYLFVCNYSCPQLQWWLRPTNW